MKSEKFFKRVSAQLIIVVILTILAYSNIFSNGFVLDDKSFIVGWNESKSLSNIPKFFAGDVPLGHEGVYRPLRSVLYAVYYQAFGTNIFWYHLHSLLIHLATTVLVYFITLELIKNLRSKIKAKKSLITTHSLLIPFLAALLFGLHPVHTETITYIASSMDAFGMMLMFLSFYLYIKSKLKSSLFFGSLAFFTNETTIVLPLLLLLYDFCFRKMINHKSLILSVRSLVRYSPYFLGVILYLGVRFLVLHITSRGPYLADSIYLTFLTMTKVFTKYLLLLILPINQANNHTISRGVEAFVYRGYSQDAIKAQTFFDAEILLSILIIASLFVLALKARKKLPVITFGIGWFFISLLPVSEIVPQGSMLGERFLYIPSFGFVLIASYVILNLFQDLPKWIPNQAFEAVSPQVFDSEAQTRGAESVRNDKKRYIITTCILLLVASYFLLTYQRNKDWHDEISLWSKDVAVYPGTNAYAYFQLGNAYLEKNQLDPALKNYNHSFEINPHFAVAIASAGRAYERQNNKEEAIKNYQKAIDTDPNFWEGYIILGTINIEDGNFDIASKYYQKLSQIYPQYIPAKDILNQLSRIEPGTKNLKVREGGIYQAFSNGVVALTYPADWKFVDKKTEFKLTDSTEKIRIDIKKNEIKENSLEDYLKSRNDTYGVLKNQGPAKIPQFDDSFVKVWQDSNGKEDILKLQFFLLKGNSILEVLVYPADSPLMSKFDEILASLKLVTSDK